MIFKEFYKWKLLIEEFTQSEYFEYEEDYIIMIEKFRNEYCGNGPYCKNGVCNGDCFEHYLIKKYDSENEERIKEFEEKIENATYDELLILAIELLQKEEFLLKYFDEFQSKDNHYLVVIVMQMLFEIRILFNKVCIKKRGSACEYGYSLRVMSGVFDD